MATSEKPDPEGATAALPPGPPRRPPGRERSSAPPEFRFLGPAWQPVTDPQRIGPLQSIPQTELGAWIDRLRRAGVNANRRNSPDLIAQLNQSLRRPVDSVLCALLDADPAAGLNSALGSRFPIELLAGVVVIGRIIHAGRVSIIADARVPGWWHAVLRRAASAANVRVVSINNDYPQADPTLLLYSLLRRRLRPGRLPTEQGVVVLDGAAAVAVGRHALGGGPQSDTPMVVRDHAVPQSHFIVAPIGMLLAEVTGQLGLPSEGRELRGGDVLRDARLSPQALVGGGELIIHSAFPEPPINPNPCIRCGWCVEACPTRVQPAVTLDAVQYRDLALAERAGVEACIECGICTYVCPSRLPLLEGIRALRRMAQESPGT